MRILFVALIFLISSCQKDYVYFVDDRLQKHVDFFAAHHAFLRENLIVRVSNLGAINGLFSVINGQRVVEINSNCVENFSNDYIEAVVMHELGHAIFNRAHSNSDTSLMNDPLCLSCYKDDKQPFLKEMFN